MKLSLNWLRQYVDFSGSPAELAERLTMLGLEVEGVQKLSGEYEGIIVAQVITRDKHPNADKLSLCRVNDGHGERQIVCGAQNFKAGDKVPLILPGASLPLKPGQSETVAVKVGKIRGVESHGMLCSPTELGLPDSVDGLLILSPEAKVGQPFAEYLGRATGDVVYDLEITPNRPDLNSVVGIAREISASWGNPLKMPEVSVVSGPLSVVGSDPHELVSEWVAVRVDEPELCPRYTARLIQGLKIGPSPEWLRASLEKVGVRSINNVVDSTNYVMLEIGQPLHAFDYHLISSAGGKPTIVVRRASDGETFTTLDGHERNLTGEMLLIGDESKGIALAGVMGGQNTEIRNTTTDVLIEGAYFNPRNIRKTSKRLALRTESSYRFERGTDIGIVDWASRRCAQLILETAGGELVPGAVDSCTESIVTKELTLRHSRTNAVLGVEIPVDQQIDSLRRLGLEVVVAPGVAPKTGVQIPNATTFRIPTWRVDLKLEVDLIEEVARLFGVDRIPSKPPRGAIGSNPFDAVYDTLAEARRILTGLGLNEAQGQTLVDAEAAELVVVDKLNPRKDPSEPKDLPDVLVPMANPLSTDMSVLRPKLLIGLLDMVEHNCSRGVSDIMLFEVGKCFVRPKSPADFEDEEQRRVGIVMTGQRNPTFWSSEEKHVPIDFFDLKGVLENFFEHFGLRGFSFEERRRDENPFMKEYVEIRLGGNYLIGYAGPLTPGAAGFFAIRQPVYLAELNLDLMLARRKEAKSFKPLPQFPSIRRDVAMLVNESVTHNAVMNVVRQAKPANLESAEVFDVFRGQNVPPGQKSVAYSFTYRHPARTLTDDEVTTAHDALVAQFKQRLQALIR